MRFFLNPEPKEQLKWLEVSLDFSEENIIELLESKHTLRIRRDASIQERNDLKSIWAEIWEEFGIACYADKRAQIGNKLEFLVYYTPPVFVPHEIESNYPDFIRDDHYVFAFFQFYSLKEIKEYFCLLKKYLPKINGYVEKRKERREWHNIMREFMETEMEI